ncbi:hypothetical protein V0R50_08675 [Pseudomonas sp. 148P]|uniref:Lipoprotein n=1 Tax=Pseudomonas ulcerans TaxID=3115852 RepID=A0ABU7HP44_9PSED|nr:MULTISPECIES: hypothetical protein [unclassified Pseudomonas]MEE1920512.1 hypothetical protein [Pseudomonas sp. 147P]MEE1933294.1 hypothetical protein [Pseudomonas sp. 148P]
MPFLRFLVLAAALVTLGGCAIGQTIDYRLASPPLKVRSTTPVQVQVVDQRPYVLALEKKPTFVGRIRGLYYNPWNVNTTSGLPLADDLAQAVRTGLAKAHVTAAPGNGSVTAPAGQKLLVLTLREWKMDAYFNVRFDFDVGLAVVDDQGKVLASEDVKGSGPVENVIAAGAFVLRKAIDAPDVTRALSSVTREDDQHSR